MTGRRNERGAALVMALVFAAGLAAAAVAFIDGRRSDGLAMRAQVQAVEAEAVLAAALQQTAALLANRSERQAIPGSLNWRMGAAEVQVVIESEAGKIDLNASEEALLQSLPLALGADEDRAAAFAQTLLDWRDDNSERRNAGAEDRDYDREEQGSSGAANRPLSHPAELRYLAGVDPATWARLAPLVTVYSGAASPSRNKAPATVRRAMMIAQGLDSKNDDEEEEQSGLAGDAGSGSDDRDTLAGRGDRSDGASGRGFGRGAGLSSGGGDVGAAGEVGVDEAAGSSTEEAAGAHAVLLDVRFPNGYEAAAKAVIGFGDGGRGGPPFTVLEWTPILREQGPT